MSSQHHDHHTHDHPHNHSRDHDDHHGHGHTHGLVDPSIIRSRAGVKAVALSFGVLAIGALLQYGVYLLSGSVALLTDTIHNAGDALTAIPLALAFFLRSKVAERWAGYFVVLAIFVSAVIALYEVIQKFITPSAPTHIWEMIAAGIIGVAVNEIAAIIRWRAGKRLDSPALIADGNHARADGYVSAGIIVSAIFIAIGLPIADPIIGLIIVFLIFRSTWQSWQTIRGSH
jgi:cation diffusion facilitator family transporter